MNIKGAKKALTAYERAQQQEYRILVSSIIFFGISFSYVMWERIIIKLPLIERIINYGYSILYGYFFSY